MPAAVLQLTSRQRPCRCDNDGLLTCAECDGVVRVVRARAQRQELLRDAVQESARHLLARMLVEERKNPLALVRLSPDTHDAIQNLRDACASERKVRHG